jgi:2-polyprenyl-3-methyl-5-hydroxy-6-metoxy-1,4-benzoquinol methylase
MVGIASYKKNLEVWKQDTYQAWTHRFGTPQEVVLRTWKNPTTVLHPIRQYFGPIEGKRIANLMGSNGIKALALTMLGADVTVFDCSPGNARYAHELAKEATLDIHYVVCDVLEMPKEYLCGNYDIVFAELGVVHYFTDLKPFMDVVYRLLKPGGRFILRDFHPVSTKLISFRGSTAKVRKYKVDGDYFDTSLEQTPVPFLKHLPADVSPQRLNVSLRKWTLGEVVTAVASAGLFIRILDEEPNLSSEVFDKGIPKTYCLIAEALPPAKEN